MKINTNVSIVYIQLPYCAIPLSPPEVKGQPSQNREMQHQQNAARGQMSRDKMWSSSQDVLYVYFVNPGDLAGVSLNTQNIIDWAKIWEHPSYPQIPKFRETKDESKAVIRVKFIGWFVEFLIITTTSNTVLPTRPFTASISYSNNCCNH